MKITNKSKSRIDQVELEIEMIVFFKYTNLNHKYYLLLLLIVMKHVAQCNLFIHGTIFRLLSLLFYFSWLEDNTNTEMHLGR